MKNNKVTGSIQVNKGKQYIVLNIPDPIKKRKQKWILTGFEAGKHKREANALLYETIAAYQEILDNTTPGSQMLFSECVKLALEEKKKNCRDVTYEGYNSYAVNHVIPFFEERGTRLGDMSCRDIQAFVDYETGRVKGNSIKHYCAVISEACKYAVRNGYIKISPYQEIVLPKDEPLVQKYYNNEQLQEFLNAIKDEDLYYLIYATAYFGLRRSEVLGLKWDSVDFDRKSLVIKHTVVKFKDTYKVDNTKNPSSNREYPLSEEWVEIFKTLKETEDKNRELFGDTYVENDYIFKWRDGKEYRPDFISRKFTQLTKKYGFDELNFHGLRHSCASMLLNNGANLKETQVWLGHKDYQTTADIYGHIYESTKKNTANIITSALNSTDR